jgi:hypothetical protein
MLVNPINRTDSPSRTRQLLHTPDDDHGPVTLTDRGQQVHAELRAATTAITQRLWGDLPAEDLATAGRVLDTVLARANVELAPGEGPLRGAPRPS